jgi:tetratricopeptide (TPR) repeat protein
VLSPQLLSNFLGLARAFALCVAIAAGGWAHAAEPAAIPHAVDDEVERHVTLGQRHLERGRYQDAIAEFRRAYELRDDPHFLFDIAEAYRQLGIVDRALFFYGRYLAALPDAPDRDEVEARMAELQQARASAIPRSLSLGPRLDQDVVVVPVPLQAGPTRGANRPRPVWRRWWFWTAVGAALVAGAIGIAATSNRSEPSTPTTDLGDKRFY